MKITRVRTTTGVILKPNRGAKITAKHAGFAGQLMRVERRANRVLRHCKFSNDFPRVAASPNEFFQRSDTVVRVFLNPSGCLFEYPREIATLLSTANPSPAQEAALFKLQLANFRELLKRFVASDEKKDAERLAQLGFDLGNRAASMRLESFAPLIDRGSRAKKALDKAAAARRKVGDEKRKLVQQSIAAGKTPPVPKRTARRYK